MSGGIRSEEWQMIPGASLLRRTNVFMEHFSQNDVSPVIFEEAKAQRQENQQRALRQESQRKV
jgi:hypothetical protein